VVGEQRVFDLREVEGTMVGFRFPDYSEGIEVSGYHLHFITADRARGGHVLSARLREARAAIDASTDLHVELPPGVDLASPEASPDTHAALDRAERWG
jgi:acetolactate decarboxylase